MPRRHGLALSLALAVAVWTCCATQRPPPGWQERFAEAAAPPPGANLPLPAPEIERLLREAPFEIRAHEQVKGTSFYGLPATPVYRITAHFPGAGRTLELKWKPASGGLEKRNNTPRREIAAYAIQQWFLTPPDYVVPPTAARCIPRETYAALDADAAPNPPDGRCVFGGLAAWLEDVEVVDPLLDRRRFYRDPNYARHLGRYNLLTYLIENRDTRPGNQLASTDDRNPRVYSIDNGVSFGEFPYNVLRSHWDELRVPALPRDEVEHLRRLGEAELSALAVVAQFRAGADGVWREVPAGPVFETDAPVRRRGPVVQLGLVPEEIDGVRARLRALLADVDSGEIETF